MWGGRKHFRGLYHLISRSLELAPQSYKAIELLAFILMKKGDQQEAIRMLQEGLKVMAENGEEECYKRLQSLLKRLGNDSDI